MADTNNHSLPKGSIVKGKVYSYRIEQMIGQGAFGITYLASTLMKGPLGEVTVQVALKEYFAKELDSRQSDGSVTARTEGGIAHKYGRAFQRESDNLSKMHHPNIVNVLEAFETNGTYYYSMEYLSGGNLDAKLGASGIPETYALGLISQIGDALSYMHSRKVMHLDLKPKNIMLKGDGCPVIIDFGLSKQYDNTGEPESSSSIGMGTPGYAPLEQATQTSARGFQPTFDIYAIGATLYKMLTGCTPPTASEILNDGFPESCLNKKGISDGTIAAIRKAMAPARRDRPQSIEDFLALLPRTSRTELSGVNKVGGNRLKDDTPRHKRPGLQSFLRFLSKKKLQRIGLIMFVCLVLAIIVSLLIPFGKNTEGNNAIGKDKTIVVTQANDDSVLNSIAGDSIKNQVSKSVVPAKPSKGQNNGHEWVDLGLPSGVKWATCNIGASTPAGYGRYYSWGEKSHKRDYSWETYRLCSGTDNTLKKYNTKQQYGKVDEKYKLDLSDDVARFKWGGAWRMPTKEEFAELRANCTMSYCAIEGKNGLRLTSKINGNTIFLPAAGRRYGNGLLYNAGKAGYYWSSTLNPDTPSNAWELHFDSKEWNPNYHGHRLFGFSIRPVID